MLVRDSGRRARSICWVTSVTFHASVPGSYYSTKKRSAHKQAKTAAATGEALKAAGKKSDKLKAKGDKDAGQGVQQARKVRPRGRELLFA
jgi:hypothetical protein